jgi:hypothetical protein
VVVGCGQPRQRDFADGLFALFPTPFPTHQLTVGDLYRIASVVTRLAGY